MDLNSILLEGEITSKKQKRDSTGFWLDIRSRFLKDDNARSSTVFRVEVGSNLADKIGGLLSEGRKIRVVGRLGRVSRIGSIVRAEHVEVKAMRSLAGVY